MYSAEPNFTFSAVSASQYYLISEVIIAENLV